VKGATREGVLRRYNLGKVQARRAVRQDKGKEGRREGGRECVK
jgi:hypothetical protein